MAAHELRATLIVRNAKVTTLAEDIADAEAVAVSGETSVAVGSEVAVMRLADRETRVIDAGGRRLIPGLSDSHLHAIRGGLQYNLEVRWDGVRTLERALEMVREQALRTPQGQWVRVMSGWSPYQFAERRMPSPSELTEAAPAVPVLVLFGYSQVMLNSAGAGSLGLAPDTPELTGSNYQFTDGVPQHREAFSYCDVLCHRGVLHACADAQTAVVEILDNGRQVRDIDHNVRLLDALPHQVHQVGATTQELRAGRARNRAQGRADAVGVDVAEVLHRGTSASNA
jgi:Amidohydrolase family